MTLRRINTVIQDFESCEHKDYKRDLNACHILDHFTTNQVLTMKLQDKVCFGSKLISATEGRRS